MNEILPPAPPPPPLFSSAHSRRVIIWVVIGIVFALFLHAIRAVLAPFIIGALVGYFLDPVAARLEKRGANRGLASVFLLSIFFASLGIIFVTLIPLLLHQTGELLNALPHYLDTLQRKYTHSMDALFNRIEPDQADAIKNAAADAAGSVVKLGGSALAGMLASGMALLSLLSLLLITPLVAFYLLRDWEVIVARLDALLPIPYADTIRERCREIDRTLEGFIHGQFTVCLVLAAYYGVFLTMTGLKFGFVIGIVTGILVVFPYVGFILSAAIASIVGFLQFGLTTPMAFVAAVFVVGQMMENYFLVPRLVGNKVGLHPLWIIFGMMAGGALFGFVGILLAVPLTAVAGVLIRHAIQNYKTSTLFLGQRSLSHPPE